MPAQPKTRTKQRQTVVKPRRGDPKRSGKPNARAKKERSIAEPPRPEAPLDDSRLNEVPQLRSIDPLDFERAVLLCQNATGREAAVNLAGWLCQGLEALAPERRRGVAYVQIDEPLGDDLEPFYGNVFHRPEGIVACVTGTRALVNDLCIGAFKASRLRAVGGAQFTHRFTTLGLWAIVQDDNVIVTGEAYFAGMQPSLRDAGWKVWTLEYNIFGLGWGVGAEYVLMALPDAVPEQRKTNPLP